MKRLTSLLALSLTLGAVSVHNSVAATNALQQVADTEDIVVTNLTTSDYRGFMGIYVFNGSNDDWSLSIGVYTSDVVEGHYEDSQVAMCDIINRKTNQRLQPTSKSFDVVIDEATLLPALSGKVVDEDGTTYQITMQFEALTPKRTETLVFDQNAKITYSAGDQVFFEATNDEVTFFIGFNCPLAEGHYISTDLLRYYTYLRWANEDETSMMDTKVDVTMANDTTFFQVDMLGTDTVQYLITYYYTTPEATETCQITIDNEAKVTRYDDYDYQIIGISDEWKVAVDIVTDVLEGEYVTDDFYMNGTFMEHYNTKGRVDYEVYPIAGSAVVKVDGDKTVFDVVLLGDDYVQYEVTMWYYHPQTTDLQSTWSEPVVRCRKLMHDGALRIRTAEGEYDLNGIRR